MTVHTGEKKEVLHRELGLYDLTLLLVVAVVNVNILPVIAAEGWFAILLWIFGLIAFLIPQAVAVIHLSKLYPGEGGLYIWTQKLFGEFHGFISGWCYWTNNLFYIPSVLFILIGVAAYTGGSEGADLAEQHNLMAISSIFFLWIVTLFHMRGLKLGKWLNNLGALGVWFSLFLLLGIAISQMTIAQPANPFTMKDVWNFRRLSGFSITVYSLVGLELGSVMGDEIRSPERIVRKAVFLGGIISILLYMLGTAALLLAVPSTQIAALSGLMQAVDMVARSLNLSFLVPAIAVMVSLAVLGICSAWLSGSARIPFVMGMNRYLPSTLGRVHSRWGTPYQALLVQGLLSSGLILLMLYGSTVADAYRALLDSSIVIQLIPFLYLFVSLWKVSGKKILASLGLLSSGAAILLAYVPSRAVENVLLFEVKMIVGPLIVLLIAFFFYRAGSRKLQRREQ